MDRRLGTTASLIAVAMMLAISLWGWLHIPADTVPVHFDWRGEPDRFASKSRALLMLPSFGIGIAMLFAVLPIIEPRSRHLAQSHKAYNAVWTATMAVFVAVHGLVVYSALGEPSPQQVLGFTSLVIGALFVVIGNFLTKVRSNFMFGIRTPWTLSSERSWTMTHRIGARLFVAAGLATVLTSIVAPGLAMVVMLATSVSLVAVLFPYSYLTWRSDPDKQAIGR